MLGSVQGIRIVQQHARHDSAFRRVAVAWTARTIR
jgi:hypothetical protein